MQSSYKVIKSDRVVKNGSAVIDTTYEMNILSSGQKGNLIQMNNYEKDGSKIIQDSIRQADAIKLNAISEAARIKKDAYHKGYEEGYNKGKSVGYEEGKKSGYTEGYNLSIEKAKNEADSIIDNAKNLLIQAKHEYESYLEKKENEIKKMLIEISREILKREIKDEDGLNSMVLDVIKAVKDTENLVIMCNSLYYAELKNKIDEWKDSMVFKGEIFVLEDSSLNNGEAIIQKENGLMKINIEYGLQKIKEILMEL